MQKQPDGSEITVLHNKQKLTDSDVQIKFTDVGISVSADGGNSWYGIKVDGDTIVKILTAEGINANLINAGTIKGIRIQNSDGTIVIDKNGEMTFKDTSGNTVMKIDRDGITMPQLPQDTVYPQVSISGRISYVIGGTTYNGVRTVKLSNGGLNWTYQRDNSSTTINGRYISRIERSYYTLSPGASQTLAFDSFTREGDPSYTQSPTLIPIEVATQERKTCMNVTYANDSMTVKNVSSTEYMQFYVFSFT